MRTDAAGGPFAQAEQVQRARLAYGIGGSTGGMFLISLSFSMIAALPYVLMYCCLLR
jgi:hypothetical protein